MRRSRYTSFHTDSHYRSSPILGALLMVAVTVLFVAVLGTFSFGIAYGTADSPQVSLSTELDVPGNQVNIIHNGGESLSPDRTRIAIINESDGRTIELAAVRDGANDFEVGDKIFITTTTGSIDGWSLDSGSTTFELRSGITYTVKIYDTKSELSVYSTSLTTV